MESAHTPRPRAATSLSRPIWSTIRQGHKLPDDRGLALRIKKNNSHCLSYVRFRTLPAPRMPRPRPSTHGKSVTFGVTRGCIAEADVREKASTAEDNSLWADSYEKS